MSVLHNWGRLTFVYQRASGSDRFVKPFGHRDATATTMASGTKLCVYRADLKRFGSTQNGAKRRAKMCSKTAGIWQTAWKASISLPADLQTCHFSRVRKRKWPEQGRDHNGWMKVERCRTTRN